MEEEIQSSEIQEGEEVQAEEEKEVYAEGEEMEYVAFSPQELELFILRSETWDKLVKGEIPISEARKMLESFVQSPIQVEATPKRGKRKRSSKS
ncbi:hypothetical protein QPL79_01125 [Ignisphaera sp. 4213-co]|uniref:RNA polymerase Rpo13 subunit HTH domain-containing protein n=1 Tax=Ignisphaera cupida TaxID=3050454 RepID=A0ABD4Z768_9CREN|nr:hypothetical protein [Ignisphaera sp. 4213-co]MDK6027968.1 hypothetical protein [Ignisphaera sp. 4213-co]